MPRSDAVFLRSVLDRVFVIKCGVWSVAVIELEPIVDDSFCFEIIF